MRSPVTIRAAKIGAAAIIVAALLGGLFQLYGPSRFQQTVTAPGGTNSPITMLSSAHDVTINYNVPDSATRDAIESLKKKAADTDATMELNRKEVLLLSQALQDLDQRTSGLHKLPDGRTLFGHFISGEPSIVIAEHEQARRLFTSRDYPAALEHSQRAIKAYEEAIATPHSMSTGDLAPENVAKLYKLGAIIAQTAGQSELASTYAEKAVATQPSPELQALLATTLFNLGKADEAIATITKATDADPSNEEYRRLREEMKTHSQAKPRAAG